MDFGAQDNEMRTSGTLSYATTHHHHHHLTKDSSSPAAAGGEIKRRVGIHNGTSNYNTHQSIDNHHIQPVQLQPCSDPDRALSGIPVVTGGSGGPKSLAVSKSVRYRECLKNHAANIGGNVFDGCGEFMASGKEGTLEALKCAACDCHRNFHRKEVDGETASGSRRSSRSLMLTPLQLPPPLPSHHIQKYQMAPIIQPMSVAYGGGGGGGTESSSEEMNVFGSNNANGGGMSVQPFSMSKKRFRTKFTADQKERMTEFAEKVGWRMLKQNEEEVERFCAEVGVKRQVFRVWMHNNKANIGKRGNELMTSAGGTATTSLSFENVEAEGGREGGAEAGI